MQRPRNESWERGQRIDGGERARSRGVWRSRAGVVVGVAAVAIVVYPAVAWAAPGGIAEVQLFASRLTNYVTAVAASIAILFVVVNGVRWTRSSGNPVSAGRGEERPCVRRSRTRDRVVGEPRRQPRRGGAAMTGDPVVVVPGDLDVEHRPIGPVTFRMAAWWRGVTS